MSEELPDFTELGLQALGNEYCIGLVDQEVGTHLDELNLLFGREPVMDSGTDSGGPGLAEDEGAGFKELGVVVLFGDAQTGGEVVWSDEDTVEAFFCKDAIEGLHGRDALDVGEQDMVGVMVVDIVPQFRFEVFAVEGPPGPFALERA